LPDQVIPVNITQSLDEDEDDEFLLESGLRPFDERDQQLNDGEDSHLKKQQKSKLPFSFLIQNYFKNNGGGEQQLPTNFLNVSFPFFY
jgi:hypothetical protein